MAEDVQADRRGRVVETSDAVDEKMDVLCVGFANQDLLAGVAGYPPPDTKIDVLDLVEQGGGPAATAAVAVARLGGRAALLAAVGDDERGEVILADLAREGVDVSGCPRCRGASSPLSMVVVDRSAATRTIFRYLGTSSLQPEDVDSSQVGYARVLLMDAHMPEAALEAARVAREAGVPVVLDAGEPKARLEELLAASDYVVPPLSTAQWITGESDPESAAVALLGDTVRAVVLTMGAAGHVVATREGVWRESAFRVEVVDTTGAGDAFHGAFALAIAWERPVRDAARFAAAVAALKCRKPGGRAGLPGLAEVEALLSGESVV